MNSTKEITRKDISAEKNIFTQTLSKLGALLLREKVAVFFTIICILGAIIAESDVTFLAKELSIRIGRNTFLVLSLIIPVLAGMGLNFGIVIGAMSAQVAILATLYFKISGTAGFFTAALISLPISVLLGWLVARLFNKMKGNEMIGGMVLGYFAEGVYQFFFLFLFGWLIETFGIKNNNPNLFTGGAYSIKNTLDLKDTLKYSIDNIPLIQVIDFICVLILVYVVVLVLYKLITKKKIAVLKDVVVPIVLGVLLYGLSSFPPVLHYLSKSQYILLDALLAVLVVKICIEGYVLVKAKVLRKEVKASRFIASVLFAVIIYGLTYIPSVEKIVLSVKIPVVTFIGIGMLCLFNTWLMHTRLGQNMRTVGQSRAVATSAGINVDRVRIIAMILSTVLAAWGQLISLQSIGTLSTYGAHTQVGQFAIASLLVGGASVQKASNKHAIMGVILFHTLFILSPSVGAAIFGSPAIGEYFRVFIAYGVIAVSLAMHAWKIVRSSKPAVPDSDEKETEAVSEK